MCGKQTLGAQREQSWYGICLRGGQGRLALPMGYRAFAELVTLAWKDWWERTGGKGPFVGVGEKI